MPIPMDFISVITGIRYTPTTLTPNITIAIKYGICDKIRPDNISGLFLFEKSVVKQIKYFNKVSVMALSDNKYIIVPQIIPTAIITAERIDVLLA